MKHNIIYNSRVYKPNVYMIPGCPLKILKKYFGLTVQESLWVMSAVARRAQALASHSAGANALGGKHFRLDIILIIIIIQT